MGNTSDSGKATEVYKALRGKKSRVGNVVDRSGSTLANPERLRSVAKYEDVFRFIDDEIDSGFNSASHPESDSEDDSEDEDDDME